MPTEYTREMPSYQVTTPLEDQASTITVQWGFDPLDLGGNVRTFNTAELTVDQSNFTGQPDRIDFLSPTDYASTITMTDTNTVTVSPQGVITFSVAPAAAAIVAYYMDYEITTLTSLRSVQLTFPGIDPAHEVLVCVMDGTTIKHQQFCDVAHPLILERALFYNFTTNLTIRVYLTGYDRYTATMYTGDASETVFYYNKGKTDNGYQPVIISLDYANQFESVWGALIAGAATTVVDAATLPMYASLRQNSALAAALASLGVSLLEAVTMYVSIFAYCVQQGVKMWSEFTDTSILNSLNIVKIALGMGLAGGQAYLMSGYGIQRQKAFNIVSMGMSAAKGIVLASALLEYLGTVNRYFCPA
jgi:hypothetical protein